MVYTQQLLSIKSPSRHGFIWFISLKNFSFDVIFLTKIYSAMVENN